VRILLDTHAVLWALAESPRLSARARELLIDPGDECWVSSGSVREIAIKVALGEHHLEFPLAQLEAAIVESGFQSRDITMRHALALERIKTSHADPFDRLLLAQCEVETLRLLTTDKALIQLPVALAC
jgi:PIN domain nuclease of toxin-antitoxin system